MKLNLGRLELRFHPLLPLMLLVMAQLGQGQTCLLAFVCVLLHELGHLAAAMALGVRALSLEIMPMGGVLHISGLYQLPRRTVMLVALAGPCASLLWAGVAILMPGVCSLQFALMNLMLCAFNLLPGMPLDGGRVLAALLKPCIGIRRSVKLAVRIGQGIGAGVMALSLWLWATIGGLSLPLLLMGVFLIGCAGREASDCELSSAEEIARLMSLNRMLQPLPMQMLHCEDDIEPERLLRMLRPDRCTVLLWRQTATWETDLHWVQRQFSLCAPGSPDGEKVEK